VQKNIGAAKMTITKKQLYLNNQIIKPYCREELPSISIFQKLLSKLHHLTAHCLCDQLVASFQCEPKMSQQHMEKNQHTVNTIYTIGHKNVPLYICSYLR